ncbi:structure-specific endonuclease subunit SLX4 [Indicator indicator]|uniref:structure-specific endonuclease subunit SLX4 n=1 Tax=Indicator indicator TaxID=1002788 RepID=UPI0023E02596|nr:structure-specific endonuclease subunit SLX4 [Indicator indicator]
MDDQDNDFKELWANILGRAKKKAGEAEASKKAQNRSKSTSARGKLKRGKAAAKRQNHHHLPAVKETNFPRDLSPKERTSVHKEGGDAVAHSSGETAQGDGRRSPFPASQLSSGASECSQRTLTVNTLSGSSQATLSFHPATQPGICSSPTSKVPALAGSKLRVAELVVERMQQFKRAAPEQLKHNTEESLAKPAASRDFPDESQEQNTAERDTHCLPSVEHDSALALALEQQTKEEALASLEDEGLFFCQICQKDLSAMNTTRREQHVNRCLDQMEEAQMSSSSKPVVPECPICGKQFQTPQSRLSHLKRCAVEMEVPPKLLLQAVQLQVSTLGDAPPQFPHNQPSRPKRKASCKEDSKTMQKKAKMETKDEDLLVAMAMSRSLAEQEKQEQAKSVTNVKPVAAFPIKWKPGSEKKRRKRGPAAPPPLLLQDPEKVHKRIQERVAMLLAEGVEFPPTPQLPTSRILENESGKASWLLPLSETKECFLWNISALTGPHSPESFYTAALTPPIVPWKPVQNHKPENLLPSVGSDQPEVSQQVQPDLSSQEPTCTEAGGQISDEAKTGPEGDGQFLSHSQRDAQTLQDLVELAREGLTLTQWKLDAAHIRAAEQPGKELTSSEIPCSGFVPPSKEKNLLSSSCKRSPLKLLAEEFGAMVNNPHLSDVQFQVDSGEVLYAHMFVLYARCPQAVQVVHSEGFLVEEDGNAQTCRVLLSEVTAEAVCAFLQYLYAADAAIPAGLLPQVRALAARFDVRDLMAMCENNAGESQMSSGVDSEDDLISVRDDNDCEDRAENFQDLLKSVWVGECEDEEPMLSPECQREDDNGVGEQELEEIYEFAATQRKMAQGETKVNEETDSSICSDTETAQGTSQQTKEEEVKRSESALVSNSSKDDNDVERSQCDLSSQEKKMQNINRSSSMSDPQTTFVPHHTEPGKWDRACHGATANEGEPARRCEDVKDSKSSQVSRDEADHCEKDFPGFQGDTNRNGSYEPLFSVTQIDYCEPSPVKEVAKESGKAPSENHVDVNDLLLSSKSQKDFSPCRNDFYGSPPPKPYIPIFPAVGSSPATPASERKFARADASTPEQSKVEIPFPSDEMHLQKANDLDTASRKEKPVSSAELPHIVFNKHTDVPVLSSPVSRAQGAAAQRNKEGDVIVLSSEDEMELEQDERSPESSSALKNTEVPEQLKSTNIEQGPEISEPEHNSSVTETDQRSTQVSCGITATVQISNCVKMSTELSLSRQTDACMESKQSPDLSPEERLDHEMSSRTDSSWLVPDTPALSKNRSFSTQTEVSSIHSIKGPGYKLSTKDLAAGSIKHEMTGDLIEVGEVSSSDKHLPVENLVGVSSLPSSPAAGSVPQYSPAVSPVNTALLSPGHTNTQSKRAKAKMSLLSNSVPLCHEQSLEDQTNISVVVVEDSEKEVSLPSVSSSVLLCNEPPLPMEDCWHVEDLSPVRGGSLEPNQGSHAKTSTASSPRPGSWHDHWESPGHVQEIKGSTPLQRSPAGRTTLLSPGKSPIEGCSSVGGRPSYLNSKIWDDWNGEEEDNFPEVLPLSQRLTAAAGACWTDPVKTPEPSCQENENSPSTPMTPMPAYSIMETPQLKKELSRFGVRALPKRQMVLKLKEIFHYTHQDVDSDFEDGVPLSQPPPKKSPAKRCRQSKAGQAAGGKRAGASRAVGKRKQVATASSEVPVGMDGDDRVGASERDCAAPKERSKMPCHPEGAKEQERLSVSPERWSLEDDGEEPMPSSQQSTVSSLSGSDISFGSQSSWMNGFETCAFASEEEEEEEEFSASQAAAREEEKLEAVRCYIRSNTALYHKVLFYEPIELAELHTELKQNGIKISRAKLLDFLDAQCITFTTAKARKEKEQKRKGNKKQRRRY